MTRCSSIAKWAAAPRLSPTPLYRASSSPKICRILRLEQGLGRSPRGGARRTSNKWRSQPFPAQRGCTDAALQGSAELQAHLGQQRLGLCARARVSRARCLRLRPRRVQAPAVLRLPPPHGAGYGAGLL